MSSPLSQQKPEFLVLALDPGREKCGVAVVRGDGQILWRRVVPVSQMREAIQQVTEKFPIAHIVLGDSTMSRHWQENLENWLPHLAVHAQDERGSTLEARELYWQANPPCGWRRLVPLSLQEPPEPIDDFAAVVLARRFLETRE